MIGDLPTGGVSMTDFVKAKLFDHQGSQAVLLPDEFRLAGREVRVRRIGHAVLLEPFNAPFDVQAWFAKLDEYTDEPFMPEGREQPPMPE
jgi:antitoxin VapB